MIWTALLLALYPLHSSADLYELQQLPRNFFNFISGITTSANLTQFFLRNPYIWTITAGTKHSNSPGFTCQVDNPTCVSLTNVIQMTNYSNDGKQYRENFSGYFLDQNEGPTSVLLRDQDARQGVFRLDILLYTPPDLTCGVFYYLYFVSNPLRDDINKTLQKWPGIYTKENLEKHLYKAKIYGHQCHVRVPGNRTHANRTEACAVEYKKKCGRFWGETVYFSNCSNLYH